MLPYEEFFDESGQLVANRVVNVHRDDCSGGEFNSQLNSRRPYPRVRACTGCGNWFNHEDEVIEA
jgi:hypothetical protein